MRFRNPENGFVESKSSPALWTFLFGGMYLISSGLWAAAIVWFVIAVSAFAALGPGAIVIVAFMGIIFSFLAPGMVRSSFLSKGWIEVFVDEKTGESIGLPELRKCPFCAEEIRIEAIKCKHCGSDLPAIESEPAAAETGVKPLPDILHKPENMPFENWMARVVAHYGVTRIGEWYRWKGTDYPDFRLLLEAIKTSEQTA